VDVDMLLAQLGADNSDQEALVSIPACLYAVATMHPQVARYPRPPIHKHMHAHTHARTHTQAHAHAHAHIKHASSRSMSIHVPEMPAFP